MAANFHFVLLLLLCHFQFQFRCEASQVPLKSNLVCTFINQIFAKLTKGASIPDISLGESVGGLSGVKLQIADDAHKSIDGVGAFGFKLNTTVPQVAVVGGYDIKYLEIPDLFPLFGSGNFSITLERVHLNVYMKATYNAAEEKFDLEFQDFNLSLNKSTVIFENLMNDPPMADFLNRLASSLLPDLLQILVDSGILQLFMPFVSFYGNGIIDCIKKEFLTGKVYECIWNLFLSQDVPHQINMADLKEFYRTHKL